MNNAFIFPGQGSQSVGMARELYENFTVAKNVFEELDDAIEFKLSKIIFEGPIEELTKTENTQPALMASSMAAVRVLESLANKKIYELCSISAGHSLGQYTALCAMGAISLAECAKILKLRGKFMQKSSQGHKCGMAAILGINRELLEEILLDASKLGICEIANDNSSDQIVISGSEEAVEYAIILVKKNGKKAIKLNVSAAFHSSLMKEASIKMRDVLESVNLSSPKIDIIDNVTLSKTSNISEIKQNLVDQISGTVRWRETMEVITKEADEVFEIGPGKVLTNLFKKSYNDFPSATLFSIKEIEDFAEKIL